jgi:hypothetical protein
VIGNCRNQKCSSSCSKKVQTEAVRVEEIVDAVLKNWVENHLHNFLQQHLPPILAAHIEGTVVEAIEADIVPRLDSSLASPTAGPVVTSPTNL